MLAMAPPSSFPVAARVSADEIEEDAQEKSNMRQLCTRVQTLLCQRKRKPSKRTLEISAPFNLRHEAVSLPGISGDEIDILREKAAASRIGIAESLTPMSRSSSAAFTIPGRQKTPLRATSSAATLLP